MTSATSDQLRQLLLRRLAPEQVARLEEAILTEEGVAEQLREAEFDLIDDYARGRLSALDRADMDRYVLTSPERVESLQVARAMAHQPSRAAPVARQRARYNKYVPVAALLAAGLAAVVVIPYWSGHQVTVTETGSITASPRAPVAADEPEQIVTLLGDTRRGGPAPVVRVAANASVIRLQAEVPEPARDISYSIRIEGGVGGAVFKASGLAAREAGPYRFVEATFSAAQLGEGAKTVFLTVDGAAPVIAPEYRWNILVVRDEDAQKK